jgi:probable addiction module antidote protein
MNSAPYDPAQYLRTEEEIVAYLNAALEEDEPTLFLVALGNIARARGMTQIAEAAGLNRESLYKMLSEQGNPEFYSIDKLLQALGLRFSVSVKVVKQAA